MTEMLFGMHSGVRYLVLAVGLVTGLLAALGMNRPASRGLKAAWRTFLGLLDVQVLIGVGVVFTRPFQSPYIGHLVMMLAALIAAHAVGFAFHRRPADARTGRPLLMGTTLVLALIVGGILSIGRPLI